MYLFRVLLSVLIILFSFLHTYTQSVPERRKVVVLHSYHHGVPWTDGINKGIAESLKDENIEYYHEYLDSKRYPVSVVAPAVVQYLKQKYEKIEPDLVIISDNNALNLIREYREELFTDVPLIFCGINNYHPGLIEGMEKRMTGVVDKVDPGGTVRLIRKLQPDSKRLFIVSGITPTGLAVRRETERALASFKHGFELIWLDGLSIGELKKRLTRVLAHESVLLILYNRTSSGKYLSYKESAELITGNCAAPVYGMWDFFLGYGIVGGVLISPEKQGREVGKLVKTFLKTGRLLPVVTKHPNITVFDYKRLLDYNLDPERIRNFSEFRDEDQAEDIPVMIIAVTSSIVLIVLILDIAGFLRIVRNRREYSFAYIVNRSLRSTIILFILSIITVFVTVSVLFMHDDVQYEIEQIYSEDKLLIQNAVDMVADQINRREIKLKSHGLTDKEIEDSIKEDVRGFSYDDGDASFFLRSLKGTELVNRGNSELIGRNVSDMTSADGIAFVKEQIDIAENTGSGFIYYKWNRKGEERELDTISYVKKLKNRDWFVGSELYVDIPENLVKSIKSDIWFGLIFVAVSISIAGFVVMLIMKLVSVRLVKWMNGELGNLTEGIGTGDDETGKLDSNNYSIKEFRNIAQYAAEIFGKLKASEDQLSKREMNYRSFFQAIEDFVIVTTPEGTPVFTNRAVDKKLGYSNSEIAIMHIMELYQDEKQLEVMRELEAMLKGEKELCTFPMITKGRTFIPVETRVKRGLWDGKDCIFWFSRNLLQEHEAQIRFEKLFEKNPVPMALTSHPGRVIIKVNNSFLKLMGYSEVEVLGKTSLDLNIYAEEEEQKIIAELLKNEGRLSGIEVKLCRKDGTIINGIFSGERVSFGGETCLLSVMVDITARRRMEEENLRLLNETKQINRLMKGRELKIMQMKEEVNRLLEELGREKRYREFDQ